MKEETKCGIVWIKFKDGVDDDVKMNIIDHFYDMHSKDISGMTCQLITDAKAMKEGHIACNKALGNSEPFGCER